LSQIGPNENTAGATSGNDFDPEVGSFVTGLVDAFSGFIPDAADNVDSSTDTTIYQAAEAPNYTPIAVALGLGVVALAWAIK
jgi:FlaG/FlaF family flagellin (archaellin)